MSLNQVTNLLLILFISLGLTLFLSNYSYGQDSDDQLYLIFEFMEVDNEQETAYAETEEFWNKVHQERVNAGEIVGWDLWSLRPGGENQGAQYLTVTLFNDPVQMMQPMNWMEHFSNAYPDMSDEELSAELERGAASRDLAYRYYIQQVAYTDSDYEMDIGTIAQLDLMKVKFDSVTSYGDYENTEIEVFMPIHQEMVDNGEKESWSLVRVMNPIGNDTFFSHMTISFFQDWEQYYSSGMSANSLSEQLMVQQGLETRTMEWVYLATLVDMVR